MGYHAGRIVLGQAACKASVLTALPLHQSEKLSFSTSKLHFSKYKIFTKISMHKKQQLALIKLWPVFFYRRLV